MQECEHMGGVTVEPQAWRRRNMATRGALGPHHGVPEWKPSLQPRAAGQVHRMGQRAASGCVRQGWGDAEPSAVQGPAPSRSLPRVGQQEASVVPAQGLALPLRASLRMLGEGTWCRGIQDRPPSRECGLSKAPRSRLCSPGPFLLLPAVSVPVHPGARPEPEAC